MKVRSGVALGVVLAMLAVRGYGWRSNVNVRATSKVLNAKAGFSFEEIERNAESATGEHEIAKLEKQLQEVIVAAMGRHDFQGVRSATQLLMKLQEKGHRRQEEATEVGGDDDPREPEVAIHVSDPDELEGLFGGESRNVNLERVRELWIDPVSHDAISAIFNYERGLSDTDDYDSPCTNCYAKCTEFGDGDHTMSPGGVVRRWGSNLEDRRTNWEETRDHVRRSVNEPDTVGEDWQLTIVALTQVLEPGVGGRAKVGDNLAKILKPREEFSTRLNSASLISSAKRTFFPGPSGGGKEENCGGFVIDVPSQCVFGSSYSDMGLKNRAVKGILAQMRRELEANTLPDDPFHWCKMRPDNSDPDVKYCSEICRDLRIELTNRSEAIHTPADLLRNTNEYNEIAVLGMCMQGGVLQLVQPMAIFLMEGWQEHCGDHMKIGFEYIRRELGLPVVVLGDTLTHLRFRGDA